MPIEIVVVILEKPLRKLVMPSVHGGKIERSGTRVKTQEGRSRRMFVGSCDIAVDLSTFDCMLVLCDVHAR